MEKWDYFKPVKADTGYKDWDMGTKAQKFYSTHFIDAIKFERGETWFTPIALLNRLGLFNGINNLLDAEHQMKGRYKGVVKNFKLELISKVTDIIKKEDSNYYPISDAYHSLVNFGCIPVGLNKWKGFANRSRLGDFPDLFFTCIKSYLTGVPENGYSLEIEGKKLKEYDWWFNNIGDGEKCIWKCFVDQMQLKDSFVDDQYNVVPLFNHKIGDPFPDLKNIKESKPKQGYTIDDLAAKLSQHEDVSKCIDSIYTIWNNRGKQLKPTTK